MKRSEILQRSPSSTESERFFLPCGTSYFSTSSRKPFNQDWLKRFVSTPPNKTIEMGKKKRKKEGQNAKFFLLFKELVRLVYCRYRLDYRSIHL